MKETPRQQPSAEVRADRGADFAFAVTALGLVLVGSVLYLAFPSIVGVLLVSGLLAYALLPLVDILARWLPRLLAVVAVALVGAGVVALAITLLTPLVIREVEGLGEALRRISELLVRAYQGARERLPEFATLWIDRTARSLARQGPADAATLAEWFRAASGGFAVVATGIVFAPIFVFMMLRSYHRVVGGLGTLIPLPWRPRFHQRVAEADRVLSGYIRGQLLVAAIVAVLYSAAFSIIGIPLAILVGLVAGIGELIPYLGGAIALIFGSLMALAGGEPLDVLWVVLVFAAVQGLEGGVISPLIVGARAKLGPVAVIVSLAIGAQLFGFLGLLFAVPAAGVIKVAARAAIDAYHQTRFFRREAAA